MNYNDLSKDQLISKILELENENEALKMRPNDAIEQERDEMYLNLFNSLQDTYYEANLDGILLVISPSIVKLSKGYYSPNDLIGKSIVEFYNNPVDRQKFYEQLSIHGSVTDYELEFHNSDGSYLPIAISSKLMLDKEGKPWKITGTMRDISNRKRAEKLLQESEALYQSIIKASPDDITIVDMDGYIVYVSPKALQMFGYEHENQIIGRSQLDFIAPEDKEQAKLLAEHIFKGNPIGPTETKAIRKDHTIFDVEVNVEFIRDSEGKAINGIYVVRDITERKKVEKALLESENQYRTLADSGQALIWTAMPDKGCNYFNKVWLDFTGRTLEQEYGNGWADGVHLDDLSRCIDIYTTAFDKREEFSMSYRLRRHDGQYRWLIDDGKPRYDVNGEFIGYIGHCLDITERKLAEEQLSKSEEQYRKDLLLLNSIFESPVNIIVFSIDKNYCYTAFTTYHSQTMKQIWGVDIQVGMNMLDVILNPEDREKAKINFDRVLCGESFILNEAYGDDNLYRTYYENFYSPVKDTVGEINGVSVFVIDATERYQATKKLENSEQKYRLLFENNPQPMWIYDLETLAILEVNDSSIAQYGYSREEFLNMTIKDVRPTEDMPELMEDVTRAAQDIVQKGVWKHIWKNGELRYVEITAMTIDSSGRKARLVLINDITDKKLVEEELIKIYKAVEQSPVMTLISGLNGDIEYVNPAITKVTGYTKEELIGQNPRILSSQEMSKSEYVDLWKTISKGNEWQGEFHNKKKSGEYYWAGAQIAPIFNSDGTITHYLSLNVDITELKKLDQELQELNTSLERKVEERTIELQQALDDLTEIEERFSLFMDYLPAVVFLKDHEGRTLFVNKYMNTAFGASQWVGKTMLEVFPGELGERFLADDMRSIELGYQKIEESLTQLDGTLHDFETQKFSIQRANKPPMLGGIALDITERKKAEVALRKSREQLDLAVKGSNDAPWDWNLETDNLYYSVKWWNQIGYTENEIPSDSSLWSNLTHPEDSDRVAQFLTGVLKSDVISYEAEFRLRHKDGHYVPILSRGFITRDANGVPIRLSGTNMDLTERKKSEAILQAAKEAAEKANMEKSEFLSRMSHELRTPMNSILGFAQLLDMTELNTKQKKSVAHIIRSGNHLLDLINEVLDITRIEAGRMTISIEPVQLKGVFRDLVDIMRPLAAKRQIEVKLIASDVNELYAKADIQRLRQVLLNLLNNAVKYNKDGGHVTIKAERTTTEVGNLPFIKITISDTGVGIPKEYITKLYTPFERLGSERTDIEGTGLGLAVVKKLVEALGGCCGVESELDEGSTFWIEIPEAKDYKAPDDTAEKIERVHLQISDLSGTVLYIEDNLSNYELVEQILAIQRPRINMVTNTHGGEAVKLANEYIPSLILLDLNLPDIDGSEVLRRLQNDRNVKDIPVVILSANGMQYEIDKLLKAGAKRYLTKPLEVVEFLNVIDEYVK